MGATQEGSIASLHSLSDDAFIAKAYMTLLGRAPDAGGAASYLARIRSGIPREVVWSEIASGDEARSYSARQAPVFQPPQSNRGAPINSVRDLLALDGTEFIQQAYRCVLGREADPAGLRDYGARLAAGTSKEQLVADMRCDPEGQRQRASLQGLDDLVRRVQTGHDSFGDVSLDDLLTLHGDVFVRAAYLVLFKREPDPQGQARYVEVLRAGFSNMHVLKALYEAPEAREKAAALPGLPKAVASYKRAQGRNWRGWYHRSVLGAPSDLPRDRELRAWAYRLLEGKR
jgi:hypothetical protein